MSDSPEARQLEASQSATPSSVHQSSSESPSTSASSAAAAAPSGPTPQTGSHALRITSNPNLAGPPPMFVKQPMQQLADSSGAPPGTDRASSSGHHSAPHANGASNATISSNMQQLQAEGQHHPVKKDGSKGDVRQARMPNRKHTNRPPRLQHDDPFLAYDVVVA